MGLAPKLTGPAPTGRYARTLCLVAAATAVAVLGLPGAASAEPVTPPDATERAHAVPILARAAESQGICYGWALSGGYRGRVSAGSNLGDGVEVDSDRQRCPVWIEVRANVVYTSGSSEADDYASIQVESSMGIDTIGMEAALERFGLDSKAFVAEPGWAICRAATVLPLLAAERGLVKPAPVVTAEPTASVPPLADAGSDMWRDRWGYFAGAVAMLPVTALLVTIGVVQRHAERNREAERQRRQAARRQRAAKAGPGGGRTREEG